MDMKRDIFLLPGMMNEIEMSEEKPSCPRFDCNFCEEGVQCENHPLQIKNY